MLKSTLHFLNIVLVNIVVFLLAFLALESATRTYTLIRKGRGFFRQNTFISCWITSYDYPPPMVESDGRLYFRHRVGPTSWEKPEDTLRIIAVGGSTTICLGAYRDAGIDYPMELERRLAREFPDFNVEVLNAGADAYSTAHSLVNIQFRLVELDPDVILLMENINDSSVNYFLDGATPDYSNKYLQSYFLNPRLQGTLSFTGLLTQSRFLSKFGLPQMLANKPGAIHLENDYRYGLHLFSRNLANIAAVCSLSNIELVLMSQPSSLKPDPSVSEEAFLAYNDEMEKVATKEGIQFIDMYSLMGHDDRYFIDKVHYTPEGVERFAQIACSELVPMVGALRHGRAGGELSHQNAFHNLRN